jgi:hypothetical protein
LKEFASVPSTGNIGVGSAHTGQADMAELFESADQPLNLAKKLGKNRIELAPGIIQDSYHFEAANGLTCRLRRAIRRGHRRFAKCPVP